jgi:hypothetical protein
MAKRARERESSGRERNPPVRMTGMGLMQLALFCGLAAVVLALVGTLMAGSASDPTASNNADSLGAGLAMVLSAPEPDTWHKKAGTVEEARKLVKEYFPNIEWGTVTDKNELAKRDYRATQRNEERLLNVERTLGGMNTGALRGLMIRASDTKVLNDWGVGARINADAFQSQRKIGGEVSVATMPASLPGGSGVFTARVYHRGYKQGKNHVGDVYVILSEAALQPSGGGGVWVFLTPLLVAIAIGLLLAMVNKHVTTLKGVARDLDQIGRGRLDLRVATGGTGEAGFLQRATERMVKNLALIQTTGSGDLDEALEKELDTATQIHESLRPSDPPRVPGYELETLFKAGRDIGGDYYDYIELDAKRIALVLADCSESLRGVPAAMVMAMTRAYLKTAISAETGPAQWLKDVNRRLARDLKSGMAVTALAIVVDTSTHEAFAASAGHRPIVIWRQGKTATVNPNGIALGLDIGPVFDQTIEDKKFSFQKNDRIVLYTDGVVSAENDAHEAYGEARFLESIRRQGGMNSAAFVNFVAGGVDKFLGEAEQNDDITICTLKRMK